MRAGTLVRVATVSFEQPMEDLNENAPGNPTIRHFLTDAITMNNESNPADAIGFALNAMSSPEARLEALRRLAESKRLNIAKTPDAQLQTWGLSRQQVEQAVRP